MDYKTAASRFLLRHWGKLLLVLFVLWFFDVFDEMLESVGLNSERMHDVQRAGHLAPFPLSRSHLKVVHHSGMFGGGTTIYFLAKPEVVTNWMQDSPGIQSAKSEIRPDGTMRFFLWPKAAGVVYVSSDRTEVGVNLGHGLDGPTTNSPIPPRQR